MKRQLQWCLIRCSGTLLRLFPEFRPFDVSGADRRMTRNSQAMRTFVRDIIKDRLTGKSRSFSGTNADGSNADDDLIGLLLSNEIYRDNEDACIDEVLGFYIAGMFTLLTNTTSMIMLLDTHPEIKAKLLEEINPPVEAVADNI